MSTIRWYSENYWFVASNFFSFFDNINWMGTLYDRVVKLNRRNGKHHHAKKTNILNSNCTVAQETCIFLNEWGITTNQPVLLSNVCIELFKISKKKIEHALIEVNWNQLNEYPMIQLIPKSGIFVSYTKRCSVIAKWEWLYGLVIII